MPSQRRPISVVLLGLFALCACNTLFDRQVEKTTANEWDSGWALETDMDTACSGAACPEVRIEPQEPTTTDDLLCEVGDGESDEVGDGESDAAQDTAQTNTFWKRLDPASDAPLIEGAVLASTHTARGETWKCEVKSITGSALGSTSVKILNALPSQPVVAISPAAPAADDDLTCMIETESEDPDGDDVTYSYAWSNQDGEVDIPDPTIPATHTVLGEAWTCTVTPTDGRASGPDGRTSVQICPAGLNRDEYPDLVFTSYVSTDAWDVENRHRSDALVLWGSEALGTDSGLPIYSRERATQLPTFGAQSHTVYDLDRDGFLDLLFANSHDASNPDLWAFLYWGSDQGYFPEKKSTLDAGKGAFAIDVGLLNDDEFPDIVIASHHNYDNFNADPRGAQGHSYIYWGSRVGYSLERRLKLPMMGASGLALGDFDNDTYLDVLLITWTDGQPSLIYWGTPDGPSLDDPTELTLPFARDVAVADLDRDGNQDIVVAQSWPNQEMDSTVVWGANGREFTETEILPTDGAQGVTIARIDDDTYPDIIFSNSGGTQRSPNRSYIYWGKLGHSHAIEHRTELDTKGAVDSAVHDLNADGAPEIIFANYYDLTPDVATGITDSYIYWGDPGDRRSYRGPRTEIETVYASSVSVVAGCR